VLPVETTYRRPSPPTAPDEAFPGPVSGIESTPLAGALVAGSITVIQLSPRGCRIGSRLPFSTKSRPRVNITAWGYCPTGISSDSPVRKFTRVRVLRAGLPT
jgi:hypothetical protein